MYHRTYAKNAQRDRCDITCLFGTKLMKHFAFFANKKCKVKRHPLKKDVLISFAQWQAIKSLLLP
jgi:hypothetical protein